MSPVRQAIILQRGAIGLLGMTCFSNILWLPEDTSTNLKSYFVSKILVSRVLGYHDASSTPCATPHAKKRSRENLRYIKGMRARK